VNWDAAEVADVPLTVVTVTSTTPAACAGAVAVIDVALFTVKLAGEPPNETAVAPVRSVPVMITDVPPAVGPADGLSATTVGAGSVLRHPNVAVIEPVAPAFKLPCT
jgi:hypothetical protein